MVHHENPRFGEDFSIVYIKRHVWHREGKIIKRIKLVISVIVVIFALLTVYQNINFTVKNYIVTDKNLPESFDHFKIVQISDLHNCFYDSDNGSIIKAVKKEKPDVIAITGDYVDKNSSDISALIRFSKELTKIADCYYITGNHEAQFCARYGYEKFLDQLRSTGIKVLQDDYVVLKRGNDSINIAGLSDPLFQEISDKKYKKTSEVYETNYKKLGLSGYTVLLAHRPYDFETYVELRANVVLSGHEHGGQIRLPFVGGLFAPGEGLFPKYEEGEYHDGQTTMIVSRGLGNGEAPIRIFNQAELVVIELER